MATDRTSYHKQYYRKQAMDGLRNTIKNLKKEKQIFMQSPEGITYKKRLLKEYREKNKERSKAYHKEYYILYGQI